MLKLAGAFYLIGLGFKTWNEAEIIDQIGVEIVGAGRAFRQGSIVEALNPRTAAFLLAFIPQFIESIADVARQFVILGTALVALNTAADVVVSHCAAKARVALAKRPSALAKMRQVSGAAMCTLGAPYCAAGWLITGHPFCHLPPVSDVAAQSFSLLLRKDDAIYEDDSAHRSFASGRASLTRVDVRPVGDWFAPSPEWPVANLHIPNSSDMRHESAERQLALAFLDLFRRRRRDLKSSRQGMLSRKTSAPVPAPFGQRRLGRVATRHASELLNSQLS